MQEVPSKISPSKVVSATKFRAIIFRIKQVIIRYPFWNYWGPVCAIALVIFISSSIAHPPTAGIKLPEFDKVIHATVYGVLGYFSRRAFRHTQRDLFSRFAGIFAVLFCLFYGAFDEIHQSYVPPRETDPLDLAADVFGAFVGQFLQRIRSKSKSSC